VVATEEGPFGYILSSARLHAKLLIYLIGSTNSSSDTHLAFEVGAQGSLLTMCSKELAGYDGFRSC
jgi:hypothetical protein